MVSDKGSAAALRNQGWDSSGKDQGKDSIQSLRRESQARQV